MKKALILVGTIGTILLLSGCGNQTATQAPAPVAKTVTPEKPKAPGTVGATCTTYKDCEKGLFCTKAVCSNPPSYTKYFNSVKIGKMKQGMPPGPKNMPVATTEFSASADAIEIDLDIKPGVTGKFYNELIDSTTGETAFSSVGWKQDIKQAGGWGTGFGVPGGLNGNYDLNLYLNDELVYTTSIKINP